MNRHSSSVALLWVCTLVAAAPAQAADAIDPFTRFQLWAERYANSGPATREALEPQGLVLASARREELSRLIRRNPERALTHTLPVRIWKQLPPGITALMETRLDAVGSLEVLALCAEGPGAASRIERTATIAGQRYQVHLYGRSTSLHTRTRIALHGIALDGQLALLDARVRPLEPSEIPDPSKPLVEGLGPILLDGGDRLYRVRDQAAAEELDQRLFRMAGEPGPLPQASPWSVGLKKVLFIRVDFSDSPGEPLTVTQAQTLMSEVNDYLRAASYNQLTLTSTVVGPFRMPQSKASYESSNGYTQLMQDARAAASAAGYSGSAFDFDMIVFRKMASWGWAGLGYVGAKGLWLNGSYTWHTSSHELGHNLGLSHSNFWQASGETIIGAGTSVEYGNPFDVMGSGDGHFNAWDKSQLDWIPSSKLGNASGAGLSTYRIYDLESVSTGGLQAVKVPISVSKDYWVEFRPGGGTSLANGASLNWGYATRSEANLLDMTPWTAAANDSPLAIGRTFADPNAHLYITPTGKGSTSPESLDVTVSVGFSASNQPPTVSLAASATQVAKGAQVTFTATASDPNSDSLAYYWDFGDGTASSNVASQVRSWSSDRHVLARVTVSDMRGGVASASVLVRVGNPATFVISGSVTSGGNGVESARVLTGSRSAFTDSTGAYSLINLTPGSYSVSVVKAGWTFAPSGFTNPVQVSGSSPANVNFTGSRATFAISGKVTSGGTGLSGVTVSAGTYSALSGATGDYVLSGVPNGTYALSAQLAGRTFRTQGFTNPVQVNGANLPGRNFYELVFDVSGEVTGQAGPHTITDGVRSAVSALSNGKWLYTLARVPPGTWNLVGSAAGLTLSANFPNPVVVSSAAVTGKDFSATSGTSYLISGYIQEGGQPLPGVVVDGGVALSTTDSRGTFALAGMVDGTYTLTPSKPGYQFDPASRALTVAGSDSAGNDFGVLNANAPPTVMIPARASANPVAGTMVTLATLGDDDDPESDLRYTWSTVFATAPVVFGRNGDNAAKSTQVTFSKAGAYAFEVVIEDLGGLQVRSQVTLLVAQTPSSATVTPPTATVEVGADLQLIATLRDQMGDLIDTGDLPEWSVSGGGTISPVGRFTAQTQGGPFTATAVLGGQSGTSALTVVVGPVPRVVQPAAAEPNPVAGDTTRLSVLGDDDEGEANLTYVWTAVNPPAAVTFSANGTNASKSCLATFAREGSYNLKVEIKDARGLSASSFLTVVVTRGLVKLVLFPDPGTVLPGGTLQFGLRGLDQNGVELSPAPLATWSVSGGGTIDSFGVFTAGEGEGSYTVTATSGLKVANTMVKVETPAVTTEPPKPGCGCSGAGGGALSPLALIFVGLLARAGRRRSAALGALLLTGCTQGLLSAEAVNFSDGGTSSYSASRQALGEVVAGYPNDQERMLLVLTNQARHSAKTPNNNECGDWSSEQGAAVNKPPLVWDHQAGVGARFTSRHLSEVGCFQHDSCCVLGDAGNGSVQCLAPGACSGTACNQTCDAGSGNSPEERFALFGFNAFSGESIAGNQGSAYEAWCSWMQTTGDRQNLYGAHTQLGSGAYRAPGTSCPTWYWTQAFGNAGVTIPPIPAASAMHAPPNPANTLALYFAANYYDPPGGAPKRAVVVVNGHCFDLEKEWGRDESGTYEAHFADPDVLPEGCHPYYFLFLGGDAGRYTYPDQGSLQVAVGQNATCALSYDPSAQKVADCETGVQQCPTGGEQNCYTADPATLKYGECRQGFQRCRNGFWSACKEMIGPFAEACDGLDNDCDGEIDEGNPGGQASCQVLGERGECKAGTLQCTSSRLTCHGLKAPQTEVCDGKDNDCDGMVDDGFAVLTCGLGECFRMAQGCVNGAPGTCTPGTPSAEVADFKDNDCDGIVDNGVDCRRADGGLGFPRPCFSFALRYSDGGVMAPTLPCNSGVQLCQADGGWGACAGEVGPSPEVCDGEDNDCDSQVDELEELGWERCGVGACVSFQERCQAGTPLSCTPKEVRPEICNGADDDCDGTMDEDCSCRLGDSLRCYTGPLATRDAGVCQMGARTCVGGSFTTCQGQTLPGQEWCNNQDDDCDGVVDDACLPLPFDAGTAADGGGLVEEDGGGSDGGASQPPKGGCGCNGGMGAPLLGLLALLGLARGRKRVSLPPAAPMPGGE